MKAPTKIHPRRGATLDGSRGFQPTVLEIPSRLRRGATIESSPKQCQPV